MLLCHHRQCDPRPRWLLESNDHRLLQDENSLSRARKLDKLKLHDLLPHRPQHWQHYHHPGHFPHTRLYQRHGLLQLDHTMRLGGLVPLSNSGGRCNLSRQQLLDRVSLLLVPIPSSITPIPSVTLALWWRCCCLGWGALLDRSCDRRCSGGDSAGPPLALFLLLQEKGESLMTRPKSQ